MKDCVTPFVRSEDAPRREPQLLQAPRLIKVQHVIATWTFGCRVATVRFTGRYQHHIALIEVIFMTTATRNGLAVDNRANGQLRVLVQFIGLRTLYGRTPFDPRHKRRAPEALFNVPRCHLSLLLT
jgi:hypothetical protein